MASSVEFQQFTKAPCHYPLDTGECTAVDRLDGYLRYTFSTAQAANAFANNLRKWTGEFALESRIAPIIIAQKEKRPFEKIYAIPASISSIVVYEVAISFFEKTPPEWKFYALSQAIGILGTHERSSQGHTVLSIPLSSFTM